MGKMSEHPRYNVVSLRVTDEEWRTLREISRNSSKSVSEVMREAMHHITRSSGVNRRKKPEIQCPGALT